MSSVLANQKPRFNQNLLWINQLDRPLGGVYIGATQSSAGIELCWEATELLAHPLISETRLDRLGDSAFILKIHQVDDYLDP